MGSFQETILFPIVTLMNDVCTGPGVTPVGEEISLASTGCLEKKSRVYHLQPGGQE